MTLDGYITYKRGELEWAHSEKTQSDEWRTFVENNARETAVLVMGRVAYDMMVGALAPAG